MPGVQQSYMVGYCKYGHVELGRFFDSVTAARRWARWFCRGFDSIIIYDANGSVLETVRTNQDLEMTASQRRRRDLHPFESQYFERNGQQIG